MKLYLASSWRNKHLVHVVDSVLSAHGHEVFDFTRPGHNAPLPSGFAWSEIDPDWQSWSAEQYLEALEHPFAVAGFAQDFEAMQAAEAVVGIQPFGRSASHEIGWFWGVGRPCHILLDGRSEPELMFRHCHMWLDVDDLIDHLAMADGERGQ